MAASSTNEDLQWKVIKILRKAGRPVMYKVFCLGTPNRDTTQDLITYLDNLPPSSTANYPKLNRRQRRFNATQQQIIMSNRAGESFDITLLFVIIKMACEGVADMEDPAWSTPGPDLENCVYMIKEERNKFMHEELSLTQGDLITKVRELRGLFIDTLNAAHRKYSWLFTAADLTTAIDTVNRILDEISNEVISLTDLQTFCSPMLLNDLEPECKLDLTNKFNSMHNINPVSFVIGSSLNMDVSLIFTDLEVEYADNRVKRVVSYQDFFVEVQRSLSLSGSHSGASVVQLEGLAGAGKTTLMTLMVKEWCDGNVTVTHLDTYQVLLHIMCRDPSTNSYEMLLQRSLPSTFTKYRSLLEPLLSKCHILVLIDGFDEATAASRQMVKDVFHQLRNTNATIVCTTRPERRYDLERLVNRSLLPLTHARIKGVHESKRPEFIEKSHEVMKYQTGSGLDTDILLQQLEELVKNEHYRLALNLILATWVCDQKPGLLRATTTQTELYHYTIELSVLKLKERLSDHPVTCRMEEWLRNQIVDNWQPIMHKEQFNALINSSVILPHNAVARLREACRSLDLPADEMLGACLSFKSITPAVTQYAAPHKGLQEFFAAMHVVKSLDNPPGPDSIRTLLERATGEDMLKDMLLGFQNLLKHTAGLLYLLLDSVPDSLAQEVVQLLHESGVNQRDEWLDVIAETHASPTVLAAIATHFPIKEDEYRAEEDYEKNAIVVTDGLAKGYSKLLPHLPPFWVEVEMTGDPTLVASSLAKHTVVIREKNVSLLPFLPPSCVALTIKEDLSCLAPALHCLAIHRYSVVRLYHDFKKPQSTIPSTHHILENSVATDQCLNEFVGQVSNSVASKLQLSHTLEWLYLSVASDSQAATLASLTDTLARMVEFTLHVTPDVSPASLTPLPDIISTDGSSRVDLYLSDVCSGRIDWAVRVIRALQSPSGYCYLSFPRSFLDMGEWTGLIHSLAQHNMKATKIRYDVSDMSLTPTQEKQVAELARSTLNVTMFLKYGFQEDGW
ncbi:hypothetical protein Pcinc_034592 [Petrolisthes cinctipes]|uniref:NACHT domain-containing protein n=1 Tax=Petrolisthes cinctipes TaxID=88211 RepID=A0AAE1C1A6_PETCI|nr:hypothetical protein Pcinc_034592 [Petrolisthes cinctipes]